MPAPPESYWKNLYPHLFTPYRPLIGPQGASQLGFRVRDRSNRTGQPNINQPRMPSRSFAGKRKAARSPARAFRRRRSSSGKRVFRKKSGSLGDIHTFKGIINAGILAALPAATSSHLGGQYIFKMNDLPIYENMGPCFDFARMNKCRLEFMPRYNVTSAPNTAAGATQGIPMTFLTGVDEIPIYNSTGGLPTIQAPTWLSQADEDAPVTEATAYDHPRISPDYLRGMDNCRETEIYKKHSRSFYPVSYSYLVDTVSNSNITPSPGAQSPVFERKTKRWININAMNQLSGTEALVPGPDYYGPMYSFGNNLASGGTATQYYDVKLHYSVSFRRLKGF